MQQPLISVIVPVYNTGNILKKTVESIKNQSFTNFELIIIDDGSTEETSKLCDLLSNQDTRINVIHKKNAGTCAARNLGIDMAKGEYITFCDHDDLFDVRILEEELGLINKSYKYELAIVGAKHIGDDGKELKYGRNISLTTKQELEDNTANILKSGILGTVWNILYRKELIGDLRFNETLRNGHEDILFNIAIYQKTSSLIASDRILYYHYIRKVMSISAGFHEKAIEGLKIANEKVYDICGSVFSKINKEDYVELQGEYIKTYATYLIHLDKSYTEFKSGLLGLSYIPVHLTFKELLKHKSKDSFCFYCLSHNKVMLLYGLIRVNNHITTFAKFIHII